MVECAFKSVKRLKIIAINKEATRKRLSALLNSHGLSGLQPGGGVVVTSSFSDSIVFTIHTRKTAFSNSTVFKSFHSGERFRNDPFSVIVFSVVVWMVAVSRTKQYRFRLKTV